MHAGAELARTLVRSERQIPAHRHRLRIDTIVIDPGHGGSNKGAIGVADVREKLLTMELAYQLRAAIEERYPDVRVLMTRYWDREVDLDARIQWANDVGADLFLSLHYNAATHDRALGYETYFLAEATMQETAEAGSRRRQDASKPQRRAFKFIDRARVRAHAAARDSLTSPHEQSKVLATLVQAELIKRLDSVNRGVKEANFAVLRGARMPAVVIESGFLTHPEEGVAVLTPTHRGAVVAALLAAIESFDQTLAVPAPPVATAQ